MAGLRERGDSTCSAVDTRVLGSYAAGQQMGTDGRSGTPHALKRPGAAEMQAMFDRHGFVPSPQCPPRLLEAHKSLVYFILRAFASDVRVVAGMLAAVVEWYRRYDELAGAQPTELELQYSDKKVRLRLACSAGCNHCCTSLVSVIGPEAVLIAEYIKATFTPAHRASLDARIDAHAQTMAEGLAAGPRPTQMCPLNVDGKCSVYAVRPFNCRKWHSFDEPACRQAFIGGDRTVVIPRANVRADSSGLVWQSVVAAFSARGVDCAELDLLPALKTALATERVAGRFVAGEPIFAAARRGK